MQTNYFIKYTTIDLLQKTQKKKERNTKNLKKLKVLNISNYLDYNKIMIIKIFNKLLHYLLTYPFYSQVLCMDGIYLSILLIKN